MNYDLASIWKKYKDTADPESKAFLTEYYLPFVKNIASNIIKKVKFGVVEYGDLVNEGIIGLIKAIEQFDIDRGIKFETYAMSIVRGAIYNSIRALDWVPERTREKTRALQKAMDNFSVMHGREGSEAEIAKEMNMTTSDVYNLISDLGCIYLLSLEQPVSSDEDEGMILDYVPMTIGHKVYGRDLILLSFYYLVALVSIFFIATKSVVHEEDKTEVESSFFSRVLNREWSSSWIDRLTWAVQFCFGNLYSALVICYFKSSGSIASFTICAL